MKNSKSVWEQRHWTKGLYLLLFIGIVLVSCNKDDGDSSLPGENGINLLVGAKLYKDMENKRLNGKGSENSANFEIVAVERKGNLLNINVSYEGCRERVFDVIWEGIVRETSPCKTSLILSRKILDSDVSCGSDMPIKPFTETLEIDLERLFGKDNAETLACSIDVYSMLNETDSPDEEVVFEHHL
ncbi:hypothetical protein [Ulvibacterium sp.]|uniref:hypothetical protein n=1 Tax=Ulvibacterium sp. TaxID=2665914 RepID=UPI003BAADEFF